MRYSPQSPVHLRTSQRDIAHCPEQLGKTSLQARQRLLPHLKAQPLVCLFLFLQLLLNSVHSELPLSNRLLYVVLGPLRVQLLWSSLLHVLIVPVL
ncbi:unnamed protein product, partial [Linum tenue]